MKYLFPIIYLTLLSTTCKSIAQSNNKDYFNKVIVGTSLTLIPNLYENLNAPKQQDKVSEYTWNTNLSLEINKYFRTGFHYMYIVEKSKYFDNQKYFMGGTYIQFNPLGKKTPPNRVYIENSFNIGNICTCTNDKPYKLDNLKYWGLGLGADLKLTNWLHLDLAYYHYIILNKIQGKYNWGGYIIGLDFPISIKK